MTSFVLKIIALSAMLIDHLGAVFPEYFPFGFRIIGRFSFPVYVYLVAEGFRLTRSQPKFLLRLFIFAILSEIPFDLALKQSFGPLHFDFFQETNIFYTFVLGGLSIYFFQRIWDLGKASLKPMAFFPFIGFMFLAGFLQADYDYYGVSFIFFMYVIKPKWRRIAVMAVFCAMQYSSVLLGLIEKFFGLYTGGYSALIYLPNVMLWAACLAPLPFIILYNGKRGPNLKWFFYASYPLHLLILGVIKYRM